MKKFLLILFIIPVSFYLLIFPSCNTTEPPPPKNNGTLTLSLIETSCTEAWVNLKTQNVSFPAQINFVLDNKGLRNISLTSSDTTVYIDSLLPNKNYQLTAQFTNSNGTVSSNQLTLQTLDTTSHNFSWQTFTFGDAGAGSSHLSDVAIINENNIWAVGEIYMNDSTGKPDPQPYGIAHWDGNQWKLMKLKVNCRLYYPNCGPDTLLSTPAYSVFAFGAGDVWVAAGSAHHFDGSRWTEEAGIQGAGGARKIWGSTKGELWFVGYSGFIAHRNADGTWQKIESGTTLPLMIFGEIGI